MASRRQPSQPKHYQFGMKPLTSSYHDQKDIVRVYELVSAAHPGTLARIGLSIGQISTR